MQMVGAHNGKNWKDGILIRFKQISSGICVIKHTQLSWMMLSLRFLSIQFSIFLNQGQFGTIEEGAGNVQLHRRTSFLRLIIIDYHQDHQNDKYDYHDGVGDDGDCAHSALLWGGENFEWASRQYDFSMWTVVNYGKI